MPIKPRLLTKLLFIYLVLSALSCQNNDDGENPDSSCCETVDLIGQWNMNSYFHELPNGGRDIYAQNYMQANTDNLFPNLIEGQIIFNSDKTFSENFKFVIVRDSAQIDTIETNLSGTFEEEIEEGGCDISFDRGTIKFQTQSGEINSSVSKNCTPGLEFPLLYRKRVDQDSITFYIWKQ